ncbi:MAG: ECF transporter S component [Clostridia bacterium]|nr:ECF transporter S component [Clostridia bacterium]
MKVKSKTLELTMLGMFSAIVILLTLVPWLGYITTPVVSITTVHIPVIIGAILLGVKGGAILGGVWGVSCMLKAWLAPPSPLEQIIFVNPLVSVIPRILVGIAAALVFQLIVKLMKKETSGQLVGSGVAAVVSSVVNSVLVVGMMTLLYYPTIKETLGLAANALAYFVGSVFALNALVEALAAAVIAIPVCKALFEVKNRLV